MSHNPTYDPEPGYDPYASGNRSGQSTPPQYNNYGRRTPPASDSGPYTNMASYRQATTGPPSNLEGAAGNGKSYRYATAETIPEDDGDMSPEPADSRQVQFTDVGYGSKQEMTPGNKLKVKKNSGASPLENRKFLIMCVVAIIFAILWVVFMGMYIQIRTAVTTPPDGDQTGSPGDTGQVKGPSTVPTTTAAPILYTTLNGTYKNKEVHSYTLSNDDIEVEVYTLGARLNSMRTKNLARELVPGLNTATVDATVAAAETDGAWHGPVCGDNPTLHQEHFEVVPTSDGSLQLETTLSSVKIVFTYSISGKSLMVKVTGTPVGNNVNTKMDICSSRQYNLNDQGGVITNHRVKIDADQIWNGASVDWEDLAGGINDFRSLDSVSNIITSTARDHPGRQFIENAYRLIGPTGIRQAATLTSKSTGSGELMFSTNQNVLKMIIDVKDPKYIEIQIRSYGMDPKETDDDRISLKSGSTYDFAVEYKAL